MIVTSTAAAFGAQVPILNGLRTLGNNTPMLNSWAGDGNYWYTPNPQVTNYYYVTFASAFGDDPVAAVNALAKRNKAAIAKAGSTGGFITGPAAIDGLLTALRRTGGSTNGARARGADGEVQERADALRAGELLEEPAHGVRPAVPGHPRAEQRPEGRRDRQGEGRPEDLTDALSDAERLEETRRPGAALRAASVSRAFEGVQALRDVTLELHRHEVVGLIGPNGAGKSTLVNILTGFDFPDEGTVELEGRDITRWRPHRRGRQGLARTFQH